MTRPLVTSALTLGLLAAACSSSSNSTAPPGVSPAGTGGASAGSGGAPPGGGGSGGGFGSGGSGGGSGGAAGSGGATATDSGPRMDAPLSTIDGASVDASSGDGGYDPGGAPWPAGGRPYIHLCKAEWTPM